MVSKRASFLLMSVLMTVFMPSDALIIIPEKGVYTFNSVSLQTEYFNFLKYHVFQAKNLKSCN